MDEVAEDVPVDRERGRVAYAEWGDIVRAFPIPVLVMRLYGVSAIGERAIGEYTLVHTPWSGS